MWLSFDDPYGERGVLERDGCPIHYWLTGPEDGPLVVLTHGAGADHRMFAAQIPPLAKRYRVLTWDMRGHGLSRQSGARFSVAAALDDLLALLDLVGGKSATFVGQSLGGNIHQELVFWKPERIRALVMIDCTCNTMPLSRWERFLVAIGMPILRIYPWGTLRRQMVEVTALDPAVRAYLADAFSRLTKDEFVSVMSAATDCLHAESGYRVEAPLLILVGEHDRTGNIRAVAPRWAKREPHCELHVIPNASHGANCDNPEVVNRLILQFLAKTL
jgi:3-oxoadipate enol-lactonase